jgi:gamma-glutamyltranspeptidase/glutathione hydrolase
MITIARFLAQAAYRHLSFRETVTCEKGARTTITSMLRSYVIPMAVTGSLLTACAGDDTFEVTEGFFGATAAEEPRAALVARDVLVAGGSAADAAVAMYFTLAATLPSSGGLGANGSCLTFQPAKGRVVTPFSTDRSGPDGFKNPPFELLSFTPEPGSSQGPTVAIPLGPRAMFALHAKYGRLTFEELLATGERLARFGAPVSKAFATDLALDGAVLESDSAASRVFLRNGRPLDQEDGLTQLDLAATLGRIRGEGIGSFYSGGLAHSFIDAAEQAGYRVDPDRLRNALPKITTAQGLIHDDHIWAIAAPNPADLALGKVAYALILGGADWSTNTAENQSTLARALIAASGITADGTSSIGEDAAELAMGRTPAGMPASPSGANARLAATLGVRAAPSSGATSFYAVDRTGMGVACSIGLGAPFGTGKMAPGLGMMFGTPTTETGDGPGAFALMVANTNANQLHMTAYGTGGRSALSALITATLDHWEGGASPDAAAAAPRSHLAGGSGMLAVERAMPPAVSQSLGGFGWRTDPAPSLGQAELFRCVDGIPRSDLRCQQGSDPRSLGLTFFESQ